MSEGRYVATLHNYEEIPRYFLTCEFHFLGENSQSLKPDHVKGSSPQLCIILI
jgi:hypothetical protein